MESTINKAQEDKWIKSRSCLDYLSNRLQKRKSRFQLTYLDLVQISNFKGGNAIVYHTEDLKERLKTYSEKINCIDEEFGDKKLSDLTENELKELTERTNEIINLCYAPESAIAGFKGSYLTALLHACFPELLPIMDRRVLISAEILEEKDRVGNDIKNGFDQTNTIKYYPRLIKKFWEEKGSLQELDRKYFSTDIPRTKNTYETVK